MGDLTGELIAVFGGVQIVVLGLAAYLGRIWASRMSQRELARLNADLELLKTNLHEQREKTVYMHRTRFDTEFKIYSMLWPKVRALKVATSTASFGRSPDSRAEQRSALTTATRELRDAVEDHRPFYAAAIAAKLFDLLAMVDQEAKRDEAIRTTQAAAPTMIHAEGVRNLYSIARGCNEVSELIRLRITGEAVPEALAHDTEQTPNTFTRTP